MTGSVNFPTGRSQNEHASKDHESHINKMDADDMKEELEGDDDTEMRYVHVVLLCALCNAAQMERSIDCQHGL